MLLFSHKVTSDSFATPWIAACQAPLSMGFPRQEYCSDELPFPSPGDLPHPGIEPMSPVFPGLAGGFFTIEPPWKLIPWEVDLNALSLFLLVSSPVQQQGSSERGSEEGRRVRSAHLLSFYSHRTVNRLHPSTRGPSSHQAALCAELCFLVRILPFSPCPKSLYVVMVLLSY